MNTLQSNEEQSLAGFNWDPVSGAFINRKKSDSQLKYKVRDLEKQNAFVVKNLELANFKIVQLETKIKEISITLNRLIAEK